MTTLPKPQTPVVAVVMGSASDYGVMKSAAYFAVTILALSDMTLAEKLEEYRRKMAEDVKQADERIREGRES